MTTKFEVWCGSLRLLCRRVGLTTTMDVRRVDTPGDGEHVQIQVLVEKHHAHRTTSQYGYIKLSPDQVPFLINALTKLRPPYDSSLTVIASEADDRVFYGLKP